MTLGPAGAVSDLTASAAANVRPNVNFLDQSSRLALTHSSDGRLKAFALSEVEEQTAVANAIVAWTQAVTSNGAADALGLPSQETADVAIEPLRPLEDIVADTGDVFSGRSVALEQPRPAQAQAALPAGQNDLYTLASLRGRAFDRLYKSSQHDALLQLSTLYTAYIQHGEDVALRNLAVRQLPSINRRLTQLRNL